MSTDDQNLDQNPLSYQPGGDHYHRLEYQPLQFAMENRLDPCAFSMLRYAARLGAEGKGQDLLDLDKILHYLELRKFFRSQRLAGTEPRNEGLRVPMSRFARQPGIDPDAQTLLRYLGAYLEEESRGKLFETAVRDLRRSLEARIAADEAAAAKAKTKAKESSSGKKKAGS